MIINVMLEIINKERSYLGTFSFQDISYINDNKTFKNLKKSMDRSMLLLKVNIKALDIQNISFII